jgi:TonB family protein
MARYPTLLALLLGLTLSAFAQAQQSKLPPCPAVDYSKNTHKERTEKWNICFGRYAFDSNEMFGKFIYEGEFRNSMPNGQGMAIYQNSEKYVGEFKEGKPNGQGTYNYAFSGNYVGEFKDGKPNGQGTYNYTNGSKYVGEWKSGKYNGKGALILEDRVYEGIWTSDKFVSGEIISKLPREPINITAKNSSLSNARYDGSCETAYPTMSKRNNEQGTVVLQVLIRSDGTAGHVELKSTSGHPRLDQAWIDSIKTCRFIPSISADGKPMDEWSPATKTFKIN